MPLANKIGHYIMALDFNGLGNMQTKAMAIETINYQMQKFMPYKSKDNFLSVFINGCIHQFSVDNKKNEKIDITEYLVKGENTIKIMGDSTFGINADLMSVQYFAVPPGNAESKDLTISVAYDVKHPKVSEVLNYSIAITNNSDKVLPQTVALIPIPAGINIDPEELLFLKKQRIIDFYEIMDGNIILYFEELDAKQNVRFTLPLMCEIKGAFDTRGCFVYKYYQPETKGTCLPGKVVID